MKMIDIGMILSDDDIGKKYLLTDDSIVEYRCEVEERIKNNEPLYKSYMIKSSKGMGIISGDMIVSEVK